MTAARLRIAVAAALLGLVIPETVWAHHCGSPSDCFNTVRAALAALVGVGLFAVLLSFGLDLLPWVGTVKGILEAVTGRDLVTGAELEWWERILGIVPIAGAFTGAGRGAAGASDAADAARNVARAADAARAADKASKAPATIPLSPQRRIDLRRAENVQLRESSRFPEDLKKAGVTEEQIVGMFAKEVPLGFQSPEQFQRFARELDDTLKQAGLSDAEIGLKGTSTTFYSENPDKPLGHHWDADPEKPGDYDLNMGVWEQPNTKPG